MAEKLTISTNIDSSGATTGLQKIFSYLRRLATTIQTKLNFRVNVKRDETVNRQVNETVTTKSDDLNRNVSSGDYVESAYKIGKLYTTMEILSRSLDELTNVLKQEVEIRQNESIAFGGKDLTTTDEIMIGGSVVGRVLAAGAKGAGMGAVAGTVIPGVGTVTGGVIGGLGAAAKEAVAIRSEQRAEDAKNAANITKSREDAAFNEAQRKAAEKKVEEESNKKALANAYQDATAQIEERTREKYIKQFKAEIDAVAKNTIEGQNVPLSLDEYKRRLETSKDISDKALDKLLLEWQNLTSGAYSGKLTPEQRAERENVIEAEIDKAVNTLKQLDIKLAYLADVQKATAKTIEDNAKAEEKLRRDIEKNRLQGEISMLEDRREIILKNKDELQDESSEKIDKLERNIEAYDSVRNMLTTGFSQVGGSVGPQYETITKLLNNEQVVLQRYRETVTKNLEQMNKNVTDIKEEIKSNREKLAALG